MKMNMENFNKPSNQETFGDKWNETADLSNEVKDLLPEDLSKLDQSKFSPKTRKLIMGAALIFASLGFSESSEAQTTYGNNVPSNSPTVTGFNYGSYNQAGMVGLSSKDQQKLMLEQAGISVGASIVTSGIGYLIMHHANKKESNPSTKNMNKVQKKEMKAEQDFVKAEQKLIKAMRDADDSK